MFNRRQAISSVIAASLTGTAMAQMPAGKPVTILVPYPPGGPGDLMARSVSEFMGERMGRPVIVDYKPGGGGQIAGQALLQAPADGSMLLMAEMSVLCSNKHLYQNFRYNPLTDFDAVAPLPQMPVVMYVPRNSPFNTLADVVAASKKKPVNYASQGGGSVSHLLGEMLTQASGGQFNHIPYKGSAPAMADTMSGMVDFLFDGIGPGLPYIAGDKLKAIAVAGPQRLPQIPTVPTTAEAGFADVALTVWFGAVVKAGTPRAVVARFNEEIAFAMKQAKNIKRFGDLGFQFVTMSPDEFRNFMKRESDRWGAFIKARRIVLD
ncbi:MAG: tripartite tricarboxylate transporter substrate binding protein [Pseudomonadota bacterium]